MANDKQFLPTGYKPPYETKSSIIIWFFENYLDAPVWPEERWRILVKQIKPKLDEETTQKWVDKKYSIIADYEDYEDGRAALMQGDAIEFINSWLDINFAQAEPWSEILEDMMENWDEDKLVGALLLHLGYWN